MNKAVSGTILAGLVLILGTGLAWAELRPVAMAVLADGRLIVLERSETLTLVSETAPTGPHTNLGMIPKPLNGIDLEAKGNIGEDLVFATAWGKDAAKSKIVQYSSRGAVKGQWTLPLSYPTGLALDRSRRILYISTLLDAAIYRLDLSAGVRARPRMLTQVSGATRLGAMVMDEARNRVFVADPFSGTVYSVALDTKRHTLVTGKLGEPSALAIAPGGGTLYVADRAGLCIWAVPLNQATQRPVRFWSSPELKEPIALTVKPDGSVWVGDATTKAIFKISRTGQLLSTIR